MQYPWYPGASPCRDAVIFKVPKIMYKINIFLQFFYTDSLWYQLTDQTGKLARKCCLYTFFSTFQCAGWVFLPFFSLKCVRQLCSSGSWSKLLQKQLFFGLGVGGSAWKLAKPILAGKLEEQGDRAVSAALCYRVLTGTRARIWVKYRFGKLRKIRI